MLTTSKSSPVIAFHDLHSHREIDNLIREEIHHTQIDASNRNIDHECPLKFDGKKIFKNLFPALQGVWALSNLPHIFSGASNSNSIGCDKNISRDFKHNPRISASVS